MGVPFGILLAVVAMVLEFIPMIGPLTAAAVILLVTADVGLALLAVLIFLVAYRMFQDYFLSPHLMGQGVQLHPLLVLFGVFGGRGSGRRGGKFSLRAGAGDGAHSVRANPPFARWRTPGRAAVC